MEDTGKTHKDEGLTRETFLEEVRSAITESVVRAQIERSRRKESVEQKRLRSRVEKMVAAGPTEVEEPLGDEPQSADEAREEFFTNKYYGGIVDRRVQLRGDKIDLNDDGAFGKALDSLLEEPMEVAKRLEVDPVKPARAK
jgi:hypothetical protein